MSWKVYINVDIRHVIPIDDTQNHSQEHYFGAEGEPGNTYPNCDCKCRPVRQYIPDKDSWLFVHDAFDGRLGVEWVNELLKQKP